MRTKGSPVNNEGRFGCVVGSGEFKVESFSLCKVNLVSGKGEFPANYAIYLYINLRSVKRSFVGNFHKWDVLIDHCLPNHGFGLYPEFRFINVLLAKLSRIMKRQSHHVFIYAKNLEI